jgi:hypothetical protein
MNIKRRYRYKKYLSSEDSKKLLTIKNSCEGRRCFIVGNGPSLTTGDLDKIADEDSFGVNRIFQMYDRTKWRPTYYCCFDKDAWIQCKTFFEKNEVESKLFLESEFKTEKIKSFDNMYIFYGVPLFMLNREKIKQIPNISFAENLEKGLYVLRTVTAYAIQLAIYMGYKEIYLLGADCNYSDDPKKNYPKELEEKYTPVKYEIAYDNLMYSYAFVKEYADKHNVNVYNVTCGGRLELFPRLTIDEVLKQ